MSRAIMNRFKRSNRGFSLMELAAVVVVTGLLAGGVMSVQRTNNPQVQCYAKTRDQLQRVREAVDRYAISNDRFPMPAARNLATDDKNYGRESTETILGPDSKVGTQSNGVIFGAVPFSTIGLSQETSIDCWGNKLTYAVTKDLTNPTLFKKSTTLGAIDVKTGPASTDPTFAANAGYVVISHGEDGVGALKANEKQPNQSWCNQNNAPSLEAKNCRPTADAGKAVIVAATFNNGKRATTNYFDDLIVQRGAPWNGVVDAVCGASHNGTFSSAPSTNLCNPGFSTSVITNASTYTWTCNGANGGISSNCSAAIMPAAVNGACGLSAGGSFATAPSSDLCNAGTNSPVSTGSSTYSWTCSGSNGGSPANCTANILVATANGVCDNGTPLGCSVGTAINDNGDTSCGNWRSWKCQGTNGGATSGWCSIKNAACAITYSWAQGGWGVCDKTCGGGTQYQSVTCQGSDGKTYADSYCGGGKPNTSQPCNAQACAITYNWEQGGWGSCSVACGGGTQSQSVVCRGSDNNIYPDANCGGGKPATLQNCNTQACMTYNWYSGGWGVCDKTCGGGQQYRFVACTDAGGNTVGDSFCSSSGAKPADAQSCNTQACAPNYTGTWTAGSCSASCGGGTIAAPTCSGGNGQCDPATKPAFGQACNTQACITYAWWNGNWGSCDKTCGGGQQYRAVGCYGTDGNLYADSNCSGNKPANSQSCNTQACVTYAWWNGNWGSCTKTCGGGLQYRAVGCYGSDSNLYADSNCSGNKPADNQACNTQACITYSWSAGGWGSCSTTCGGGTQSQTVVCRGSDGNTYADSYCGGGKPATAQACNTQACAPTITQIALIGINLPADNSWQLQTAQNAVPTGLACTMSLSNGTTASCNAAAWAWVNADAGNIRNAIASDFSVYAANLGDYNYNGSYSHTIGSSSGKTISIDTGMTSYCAWSCGQNVTVTVTYQ